MGLGGFIKGIGKGIGKVAKKGLGVGAAVGTLGAIPLAVKAVKKSKANKRQRQINAYDQLQGMIGETEAKQLGILGEMPGRQSIIGSEEAKALQQEAYGGGPMKEYEAQRSQAKELAGQQERQMGEQLASNLETQSIGAGGAQANAYSQLAQQGGLSSGARERIASGLGGQSMAERQAARLQAGRGLADLRSQAAQQQLGITAAEGATQRGLRGDYLRMKGGDIEGINAYEMQKYGKKADIVSGTAKARQDAMLSRMDKGF